uniref:Uncharacterized protein n=1 Tax=Anguilla anguilla TaxID=7936 RepID=A0A0E9S626_ANGAN
MNITYIYDMNGCILHSSISVHSWTKKSL